MDARESLKWYGIAGGPAAVERLWREGWPEGVARAREAIGSLTVGPIRSWARERRRSDEGDELDIDRVYRGDLDTAWERRIRVSTQGRTSFDPVRVWVSIGASFKVPAEHMFWRGAGAVLLCEALQAAQIPCELWAFSHATRVYENGADRFEAVLLKSASDSVNVERLVLATGLAGSRRLYGFLSILSHDSIAVTGLGYSQAYLPADVARPSDIVITSLSREAIVEQLQEIAVSMEASHAL